MLKKLNALVAERGKSANSEMENFFGLLKSELLYHKEFNSLEELREDVIEYMEYYNNKRIKLKLKGMSPLEYSKILKLGA